MLKREQDKTDLHFLTFIDLFSILGIEIISSDEVYLSLEICPMTTSTEFYNRNSLFVLFFLSFFLFFSLFIVIRSL